MIEPPNVTRLLALKAARAQLIERLASGDATVSVEHVAAANEAIKAETSGAGHDA
jgi:hypothetical protein